MFRQDPGECPICGAAHTACRADSGAITQVQLPQRDEMLQAAAQEPPAELVPAESEPFSTAEYSRAKHGQMRRR